MVEITSTELEKQIRSTRDRHERERLEQEESRRLELTTLHQQQANAQAREAADLADGAGARIDAALANLQTEKHGPSADLVVVASAQLSEQERLEARYSLVLARGDALVLALNTWYAATCETLE